MADLGVFVARPIIEPLAVAKPANAPELVCPSCGSHGDPQRIASIAPPQRKPLRRGLKPTLVAPCRCRRIGCQFQWVTDNAWALAVAKAERAARPQRSTKPRKKAP